MIDMLANNELSDTAYKDDLRANTNTFEIGTTTIAVPLNVVQLGDKETLTGNVILDDFKIAKHYLSQQELLTRSYVSRRDNFYTTILQTCIIPSSDLRDNAMFSDLTGRFPATAMDGSQYILLSVYKRYTQLELLGSHVECAIIDAYSRTYQWFSQLGHFVQFQVMDNEAPKGLR
jgi:hypothetical protein